MVELIKGFVINYELLLNVNLIVGTTFLINGQGLNYNKSESHLSLKYFTILKWLNMLLHKVNS